jgi:hypothetical protein
MGVFGILACRRARAEDMVSEQWLKSLNVTHRQICSTSSSSVKQISQARNAQAATAEMSII